MWSKNGSKNGLRRAALDLASLALALLATAISVAISAYAGAQRGGTGAEKLIFAGFSIASAMGVLLIPALIRRTSVSVHIAGMLVWVVCILSVTYGHASYFLGVRQQVGEHRAASIALPIVMKDLAPKRNLSVILAEQAKWISFQASTLQATCTDNCVAVRARERFQKARILALQAEADEVKHWQLAQEQLEVQREVMRSDPVTTRLATSIGVTEDVVGLVTCIMFSVILEGLGCLMWVLAFQKREPPVTHAVTATVIGMQTRDPINTDDYDQALSETDQLAAEIGTCQ